ncbi:hypothetical protein AAMO2058_000097100 [Amorphochlora amoebiformis]
MALLIYIVTDTIKALVAICQMVIAILYLLSKPPAGYERVKPKLMIQWMLIPVSTSLAIFLLGHHGAAYEQWHTNLLAINIVTMGFGMMASLFGFAVQYAHVNILAYGGKHQAGLCSPDNLKNFYVSVCIMFSILCTVSFIATVSTNRIRWEAIRFVGCMVILIGLGGQSLYHIWKIRRIIRKNETVRESLERKSAGTEKDRNNTGPRGSKKGSHMFVPSPLNSKREPRESRPATLMSGSPKNNDKDTPDGSYVAPRNPHVTITSATYLNSSGARSNEGVKPRDSPDLNISGGETPVNSPDHKKSQISIDLKKDDRRGSRRGSLIPPSSRAKLKGGGVHNLDGSQNPLSPRKGGEKDASVGSPGAGNKIKSGSVLSRPTSRNQIVLSRPTSRNRINSNAMPSETVGISPKTKHYNTKASSMMSSGQKRERSAAVKALDRTSTMVLSTASVLTIICTFFAVSLAILPQRYSERYSEGMRSFNIFEEIANWFMLALNGFFCYYSYVHIHPCGTP